MSAGAFSDSKYSSNSDNVYSCRVQPETLLASIDSTVNEAPTEDIDQEVSSVVSRGKRTVGMNMRTVSLAFTSTLPTGYLGTPVRIPVMSLSTFNSWTATPRLTGTYLGVDVKVVGSSPETKR